MVADHRSDLRFAVMATIFVAKSAKNWPTHLHTSLWHSETDYIIATPMDSLTASIIFLHRVEIWIASV